MTPTRTNDPPHSDPWFEPVAFNSSIELALIGAVIVYGPEAIKRTDGALQIDDFSPPLRHLWEAVTSLAARELAGLDAALIANELGPRVEAIGGPGGLRQVHLEATANASMLTSIAGHAQAIRHIAQSRRLQATALELVNNPGNGQVDSLIDRLDDLRSEHQTKRLTLTPAASIELGRPHWVWDQRIPVGGVTLMAGKEGDGKTLLVCWLAARISRGQLPGERRDQPCDVIYVGLEDDRSTVINPRLVAAGADLDRFHFVDVDGDRPFALDHDLTDLASAIGDRQIGLIVFDPLDAHLGAVDSHKKGEVQSVIGRLAVLSQELRCGALGLAHFNKAGLTDLLIRINGSRGFTSAVRSVLAVGPHPDDENDRLCVLAKANMTSKTDVPAVRFTIEGASVTNPGDGDGIDTARIVLIGEEEGHHPDSLLATATNEERSLADEAVEWLTSILADGPMAKADVTKLARHEGFTDKALRIARERLHLIVERDQTVQGRPSRWSLPV